MLTSVAHYSYGYPTSEPIDVIYDPIFDLTTPAGRAAADERIARDDPYLLTFAPVCGPWSPWQNMNMTQVRRYPTQDHGRSARNGSLSSSGCVVMHDHDFKEGDKFSLRIPAPSAIWDTNDMDKLLNQEEHYDQITGEMPLRRSMWIFVPSTSATRPLASCTRSALAW